MGEGFLNGLTGGGGGGGGGGSTGEWMFGEGVT